MWSGFPKCFYAVLMMHIKRSPTSPYNQARILTIRLHVSYNQYIPLWWGSGFSGWEKMKDANNGFRDW
jgi:hypothetical protein